MLEAIATLLSLSGAFLMSSNSKRSKYAYLLWPFASMLWALLAVEKEMVGFLITSCVFTLLEFKGLYKWIIKDFLLTKHTK